MTPDIQEKLIQTAVEARSRAYAPYSKFQVGVALLSSSGEIISGVNVENCAYPLGICAERAAIATAVGQGFHSFEAIAVVSEHGGAPCGGCRQVLREFAPELRCLLCKPTGKVCSVRSLEELLPESFGPQHLLHA